MIIIVESDGKEREKQKQIKMMYSVFNKRKKKRH
jgi:hypothetical protein